MSMGRPASSEMEKFYVNNYLFTPEMQAMGMYKDGFHYGRQEGSGEGNLIIKIGEGSKTLFSSHTDTVHRTGVEQNVIIDPTQDKLKFTTDSGQCLGGDDGTGVWLMLELIKAGVPGLYIFHRAEEVGGQGSSYIANTTPELIEGYERAIAFDRKDDWSIITHQSGVRTCSEEFAKDLARELSMGHRADSTGSFTDTANYDTIIPECTNLSVGYHNAHSARENQEIDYLLEFRDALIKVDWENLVTARDPEKVEYSNKGYYGYGSTLVRPSKKTRDKVGWSDYDDMMFEKEKEKTSKKIMIEDDDWEEDIGGDAGLDMLFEKSSVSDEELIEQLLNKDLMSLTEEENLLLYRIDDGIISDEEAVKELKRIWNIADDNYDDIYEFLDDYPKGDSTSKEDFEDWEDDETEPEKTDMADMEGSDYDWDKWFNP